MKTAAQIEGDRIKAGVKEYDTNTRAQVDLATKKREA
jgi:hypothetical protein